jgi:hypothetical protein
MAKDFDSYGDNSLSEVSQGKLFVKKSEGELSEPARNEKRYKWFDLLEGTVIKDPEIAGEGSKFRVRFLFRVKSGKLWNVIAWDELAKKAKDLVAIDRKLIIKAYCDTQKNEHQLTLKEIERLDAPRTAEDRIKKEFGSVEHYEKLRAKRIRDESYRGNVPIEKDGPLEFIPRDQASFYNGKWYDDIGYCCAVLGADYVTKVLREQVTGQLAAGLLTKFVDRYKECLANLKAEAVKSDESAGKPGPDFTEKSHGGFSEGEEAF